jgi:hypothetical protein
LGRGRTLVVVWGVVPAVEAIPKGPYPLAPPAVSRILSVVGVQGDHVGLGAEFDGEREAPTLVSLQGWPSCSQVIFRPTTITS